MFLDLFGTVISFLATYYFVRANYKAWILTFFAALTNLILYWQKAIYADSLLELFYALSACYGYYTWQQPKQLKTVFKLTKTQWLGLIAIFFSLFIPIFYILHHFFASKVAALDALTTSLSLLAQGLMGRKYIDSWKLWGLADFLYLCLYTQKGLFFHAGLMMIYLGMAILGHYQWKKDDPSVKKETEIKAQVLRTPC